MTPAFEAKIAEITEPVELVCVRSGLEYDGKQLRAGEKYFAPARLADMQVRNGAATYADAVA